MKQSNTNNAIESLEIELLLEGVFKHYGYDFRDYAKNTLLKKIYEQVRKEGLTSITGLLEKILHNPDCMERFVHSISIPVSTMFRDSNFFDTFRKKVVPLLRAYPFIRIWHVGCAKGEEAYSMAILLHEEGLYKKCRLYATDLNEDVIRQAKKGIYPLSRMQEYTRNYIDAGGTKSFSEYYTAKYDHVILRPWLRDNIIFSQHNLVSDGPFNEFNVILCRNVMIYFNKTLQNKAHELFYNNLVRFGFLGLGEQESIKFSAHEKRYQPLSGKSKIYKKKLA
jgi:chemotaxis protein methyltransferase CheR